ncbi:MAG: hypothetical protein ACOCRK_09225 [bacterium]
MANNIGTLIIAPVRPQSEEDKFPVAFAEEIRGGHHQVKNEAERINIPTERLKNGMLVSVNSSNKTYQYSGGTWKDMNFDFLNNIEISGLTNNNQILTYDQSKEKWINKEFIGLSLYETGSTILNKSGYTEFVIGNKLEDRGITIDYTLSRSGSTEKYQIGRLYIIHDNDNVKISDEYVSTGDFKIVEFYSNFDGFDKNIINLKGYVENGTYDVKLNYHLKKIKF